MIVKTKVFVPVPPALVALRVTDADPELGGFPDTKPVAVLIARPPGRGAALKLVGTLVAVIE